VIDLIDDPIDELPDEVREWAPLVGRWSFENGTAHYLGPQDSEAPALIPLGLAISNARVRTGRIHGNVVLPEVEHSAARIVIGHDPALHTYYSIGVGGDRFAYVLDRLEPARGWTQLYNLGTNMNLEAGHPYELDVLVHGQRVELIVDGVSVFATTLPTPLDGDQVGVTAWGGGGVQFDDLIVYKQRPRAFAVMQFGSPFDAMYSDVIRPVCEELGLHVERADDWYKPGVIMQDVIDAIATADVVIAEITPDNPNVYYEVGYAHAAGTPTVLLYEKREDSRLPFDISGYRVIFYEDSIGGKSAVERDLQRHLASILR
jgi:hypothetical protein